MTADYSIPRVVIPGVGVVSPIGIGNEPFWDSLVNGRSGIDFLRAFPGLDVPSKLAAEVRDFDPLDYIQHKKMLKVMSRDIQLGVSAAGLAMTDAKLGLHGIDPERLGVEFGAGHISITPGELGEAAAACTDEDQFEYT